MYNIQNASGRNIALMLERGGYVFRPGKYLDLDSLCTRKWINANYDIKRLKETGAIRLVHDSEEHIPSIPVKPITRYKTPAGDNRIVSTNAVEVMDLSAQPDVEVDELGRLHKPDDTQPVAPVTPVVEAQPIPVVAEVVIQEPVPEPVVAAPVQEVITEKAFEIFEVAETVLEDDKPLVSVPVAQEKEIEVSSSFHNRKNKKKKHYYPSIDSTEDPVEQQLKNLNK
jgi:hypothetical protein